MARPLVIIESPFAPTEKYTREENVEFARAMCRLAFDWGNRPFASHLLYPQFMDDEDPRERLLGILMGHDFFNYAQEVWFCLRQGEDLSQGMADVLDTLKDMALRPTLKFMHFAPPDFQKPYDVYTERAMKGERRWRESG